MSRGFSIGACDPTKTARHALGAVGAVVQSIKKADAVEVVTALASASEVGVVGTGSVAQAPRLAAKPAITAIDLAFVIVSSPRLRFTKRLCSRRVLRFMRNLVQQ